MPDALLSAPSMAAARRADSRCAANSGTALTLSGAVAAAVLLVCLGGCGPSKPAAGPAGAGGPGGGMHETVIYGLGELHLRLLLERLAEVHKFEVVTRPPRIAYRETVTASAEGHHRHKKQTGGAGQFGEVFLRVEPLPRGAGFEFVDAVKGGTIPGVFMPAVEKGVRQAMDLGVIAGHPVTDLRVTVYEGKHHSVDSKEIAFVTAGRKALADAVMKAAAVVLEPLVLVEITAPEYALGDVTGDLSSKRAEVSGTVSLALGQGQVRAHVPLSELDGYQSRLNSLTSGQGRYTLTLSHYDVVPPSVQQAMVRGYQAGDDDE